MPLTQLDDYCALVIIDLQKGIVGFPMAHPVKEIIDRSAKLARAFRAKDLPVILVNVDGLAPGRVDMKFNFTPPPGFSDLIPELEQKPSDYLVTKQRPGAFIGTGLDEYLRHRSITQIVLTGIATSIGVEATARSAYDLGYNVALVVDAMTDIDTQNHQHSVDKILPKIGEVTETHELLKSCR
jgi:nicotinamidase-related amidase